MIWKTYHKIIEILFIELKDEICWSTDEEFEEVKQKCTHLTAPFPTNIQLQLHPLCCSSYKH
jgi:hypothetical protein